LGQSVVNQCAIALIIGKGGVDLLPSEVISSRDLIGIPLFRLECSDNRPNGHARFSEPIFVTTGVRWMGTDVPSD